MHQSNLSKVSQAKVRGLEGPGAARLRVARSHTPQSYLRNLRARIVGLPFALALDTLWASTVSHLKALEIIRSLLGGKASILASGRTSHLLRVAIMLWVRKAFRMWSTLPLWAQRAAERKRVWRPKARAPRERKVWTEAQCIKVLVQERALNLAAKYSMRLFVLEAQLPVRNTASVSGQSRARWVVLHTIEARSGRLSKLAVRVIWSLRQPKMYNFLCMRCQNKSLNYNTQKLNQASQ